MNRAPVALSSTSRGSSGLPTDVVVAPAGAANPGNPVAETTTMTISARRIRRRREFSMLRTVDPSGSRPLSTRLLNSCDDHHRHGLHGWRSRRSRDAYRRHVIKLVFCLRRKPTLSREDFQAYWREIHAPLVAERAEVLQIRRYVQSHSLPAEAHVATR